MRLDRGRTNITCFYNLDTSEAPPSRRIVAPFTNALACVSSNVFIECA